MTISVIICTHDPRPGYLRLVLDALRKQSLPLKQWELLLIDNASSMDLAEHWDLSWHPNAKHIREEELGLTPARLRGIRESNNDIIVFVDDDNVLKNDYLVLALSIMSDMHWLGAIGGQIIPEYEDVPPSWLKQYENILSNRRLSQSRWSNNREDWQAQPWGAGLVIRRSVCEKYSKNLQLDPRRRELDRKGKSLISGGDTDLVLTSLELGLGFGVFSELEVIHLIPKFRMTAEYIVKLMKGLSTSRLLVDYLHGKQVAYTHRPILVDHLRHLYHFVRRPLIVRRIELAIQEGEAEFRQILTDWKKDDHERSL